jgi:hypothetical protein
LVLRPRLGHWLPLCIPAAFPGLLGVLNIANGGIAVGFGALAFAIIIVGYNGFTKVAVGEEITFARYGWRLWHTSTDGAKIRAGRIGDFSILPAYIVSGFGPGGGGFPKSMLKNSDVAKLRAAVERRGGEWAA